MVNVTHDGNHRRASFLRGIGVTIVHYRLFQLVFTTQGHFVAHLFCDELCGFLVDDLVNGRHRAHLHHRFNDQRTFHRHFVRQFGYGDGFANHNIAVHGLSGFVEALLQCAWFTMFATFTATNLCTRFFAVSFRFGMFVAFFRRTRCFRRGTRTRTASFYLTVVFIFRLTGMG